MPTVVKLGGRNKKRYFDFGALMIVLFTAELKGWTHNGGNREIFNKEDSRALCAALKRSLPEIEESAECARAGARIDARALMQRMAEAAQPRPAMLEAVARIRASGRRAAALTNNWASESDASRRHTLQHHFDLFVESSVVGLRKPDPAIYRYTCERLGAEPAACAFLDDIGSNLKSARTLGMATIKVDEAAAALRELSALLDLPLGAE